MSFNVPVTNSFIWLAAAAGGRAGGRDYLGVGIGGEIPAEFEACGVPAATDLGVGLVGGGDAMSSTVRRRVVPAHVHA